MVEKVKELDCYHGKGEELAIAKTGMLQGYIVILIGEIRGHGMHVPSALFIPGRDPSIQRNETKYMPVPLDPTSGWGFAPILDWARGLTPRQASF